MAEVLWPSSGCDAEPMGACWSSCGRRGATHLLFEPGEFLEKLPAQPAAPAWAGEDIEREHAVPQGGPGPRARGAGGAGAGLALARGAVWGRAAGIDGLRAPASMRGEDGHRCKELVAKPNGFR